MGSNANEQRVIDMWAEMVEQVEKSMGVRPEGDEMIVLRACAAVALRKLDEMPKYERIMGWAGFDTDGTWGGAIYIANGERAMQVAEKYEPIPLFRVVDKANQSGGSGANQSDTEPA